MENCVDKLYLYHGRNYVGYFDVLGAFDLEFHVSNEELDFASEMLLKFNDLSTNEKIKAWLSTRLKPRERQDWLLTLCLTGITAREKWGILIETHCVSYNDTFWWNTEMDTEWYKINHPYSDLVDGAYMGD